MTTFEALYLMVSFSMLIIAILSITDRGKK